MLAAALATDFGRPSFSDSEVWHGSSTRNSSMMMIANSVAVIESTHTIIPDVRDRK